jgi:hypothetical protein
MTWVEHDGRNRKASKIVTFVRAHLHFSAGEIERMAQSDLDAICVRANVRRASDKTWSEVVTIMRALEANAPKTPAPIGTIVRNEADVAELILTLRDFAHRGAPCNLHVVGGDGVARPIYCFILTVDTGTVDVVQVTPRVERAIPLGSVRAVVDA